MVCVYQTVLWWTLRSCLTATLLTASSLTRQLTLLMR